MRELNEAAAVVVRMANEQPMGLVLPLLMLAVYFLPTLVAVSRWHINTIAIFMLNLLLGWSLIGWVVALVWSHTAQAKR